MPMMVEFTEITTGNKVAFQPDVIDVVLEIEVPDTHATRLFFGGRCIDVCESYSEIMTAIRATSTITIVQTSKSPTLSE